MIPQQPRHRILLAGGLAGLLAVILLVYAYYDGDQAESVAWSGTFTIDTTTPLLETQPFSTPSSSVSGYFTIDTRDSESIARPIASLIIPSPAFVIDTRDPESVSFALSLLAEETSAYFTIDTRADDPQYAVSGYFTIDTTDPDIESRLLALTVADFSEYFTIDTRDPPPLDTDNDGLHDIWEEVYFGPNLLITDGSTDWDGDGFSNFLEFAFGMNPKVRDASPVGALAVERGGGQSWFYFRYSRHIYAAQMIDYSFEFSGVLSGWLNVSGGVEEVKPLENRGGAIEIVTMRYLLPSWARDQGFIRMGAEEL